MDGWRERRGWMRRGWMERAVGGTPCAGTHPSSQPLCSTRRPLRPELPKLSAALPRHDQVDDGGLDVVGDLHLELLRLPFEALDGPVRSTSMQRAYSEGNDCRGGRHAWFEHAAAGRRELETGVSLRLLRLALAHVPKET